MFRKKVKKSGHLDVLEESDRLLLNNKKPNQDKELIIQGYYHPKAYQANVYTLFNLNNLNSDEFVDTRATPSVRPGFSPVKPKRG